MRVGPKLAWSCTLALILVGGGRSAELRPSDCRTDFTIYIDLSATVTSSRNGQPAPLITLAEMLSRLLTQDQRFARDGDRLHIVAIGAQASTILSVEGLEAASREALRLTLTDLTKPDWREGAAVAKIPKLDDFVERTNLQSLFDDVADRVVGPNTGRRQVFIVASDFSDDPSDNCDAKERTVHMRRALSSFVSRKGVLDAFVPPEGRRPYAQMILLSTQPPDRCDGLDASLSRELLDGLGKVRPHILNDFDERDAVQLATDVRERSMAAISIDNVSARGSRLAFEIFNPTCTDVTIDKVILSRTDRGATSEGYPIDVRPPVTITADQREGEPVEIDHPQVKTWRNARLTLQPLAVGVKSLPVEFWNGDSISIERASPKLLPQIGNEGKLVMVVDMIVDAESDQTYRFSLPDVPSRSDGHTNENTRDFEVTASGGEPVTRHVALVYDVTNEELEKLRERTSLVLRPEGIDGGRVTGEELRSDGTQPTDEPRYHGLIRWAPALCLAIIVVGVLTNIVLRIFGRGDTFHQAFSTSVDLGTVVGLAIAAATLKPWNTLELFQNKPVYWAAIAFGMATWLVCLFGMRTAILTMWEVVFRNTRGEKERRRRDRLARLLFWVSPLAGVIVFGAVVRYIAGVAPIVTGGG